MKEIKHLELFTGIGGFSVALRNVYPGKIKTSYSEIDKYAEKIYKKHFPEAKALGDIKTIQPGKIGYHDLVTFGFPCQDLSIAGRRSGFKGSRSSLFFEAIGIINKIRPKYFLAENVKGFFSSHNGKDFIVALKTITDIGYDCQWQLLNTKWFLPQNRERIFIIGHLRTEPRPKVFPLGESNQEFEPEGEYVNAIDSNYSKGPNTENRNSRSLIRIGTIGDDSEATRVYDPAGISRTIKDGGGLGAKTGLYVVGYTRDKEGKITNHLKKEFGTLKPTSGSNSNQSEFIQDKTEIRRLTPTECERLQGFEDGYTEYGSDGKIISDTQRYKVLGNAISIPPVEEIFRRLYDGIK